VYRKSIDSATLSSVGYDQESNTLEVEFTNGSVYQYFDVPIEVVVALLLAESAGRYHNAHIRNRYRHARLLHG
jgi:hypothetical protein